MNPTTTRCKRCNDDFNDYMTGNAPANDHKCNDYHQNDGAKRRNDYKCATISTVAGYLPAMRKICPTTLADRANNNKIADIKSARKENQEGADPEERMADRRARWVVFPRLHNA